MINGRLVNDSAVLVRLREIPQIVSRNAERAIAELTIRLQRKVIKEKLDGQVLNVRTGILAGSISSVTQTSATRFVGFVGTNVSYANAHEYGVNKTVSVKEHLRMITMAWGKPIKNPRRVEVRAHSMRMNLPARSFLRFSLDEMQPEIFERIEQALKVSS